AEQRADSASDGGTDDLPGDERARLSADDLRRAGVDRDQRRDSVPAVHDRSPRRDAERAWLQLRHGADAMVDRRHVHVRARRILARLLEPVRAVHLWSATRASLGPEEVRLLLSAQRSRWTDLLHAVLP